MGQGEGGLSEPTDPPLDPPLLVRIEAYFLAEASFLNDCAYAQGCLSVRRSHVRYVPESHVLSLCFKAWSRESKILLT